MGYKQCIQRLPTSQLPSTWLAGLFGDAALGRRMAGGARVIILGSLVCLATAVDAACAVNADNGSSRRRLSASGDQPKIARSGSVLSSYSGTGVVNRWLQLI